MTKALSRRNFLQFAAGSAATLPAVALAEATDHQRLPPLSDEDQLEACIAQLKGILQRMHPEATEVKHQYASLVEGRSFSFWIAGKAPPLVEFDGPGYYQVGGSALVAPGVYFIERRWCNFDKRWNLHGAYNFDGHHVGPREIIEPHLIIRKMEGASDA